LLKALEGVDIAFHLAAITAISEARADLLGTFATNSLGTLNLLMAAKEKNTQRLVYVSTCQVYGKQENFPITEDSIPHPMEIYSASKLAGETLALSFAQMYGMNITISRAFNHYGPRQRLGFLIPEVISKLLNGSALEMKNPASTRDFTYVDDIVRGYALLADKGRTSEIYHFCSGIERSVEEIVETVVRISGVKPEIRRISETPPMELPRSFGDYSKANREMGWTPRVDFEDGIKRTLAWYRANRIEKARAAQ
jgi:nucleoside-diphosphate-sugar epimerase